MQDELLELRRRNRVPQGAVIEAIEKQRRGDEETLFDGGQLHDPGRIPIPHERHRKEQQPVPKSIPIPSQNHRGVSRSLAGVPSGPVPNDANVLRLEFLRAKSLIDPSYAGFGVECDVAM